jgi:hypothetical protein
MSDEREPVLRGGCQCGAVRYALYSEPREPSICHCRMCQKAFGNYFAPLAGVPMADLVWTKGKPGRFRSSDLVERGFCRDCGTPLFFRYLAKDRISVSIGSLDEPGRVKPVSQYGSESRLPAFFELAGLPEEPTEPELRPISHQHPDHEEL